MPKKIITAEDIQDLRLDEKIKEELYDLKETAEQAGAIGHLLNSEGWQELKEAILEDAQGAIFEVIRTWRDPTQGSLHLDVAIARMEQLITFYSTVQGSGRDAKEAEDLLANRVQEIVSRMG